MVLGTGWLVEQDPRVHQVDSTDSRKETKKQSHHDEENPYAEDVEFELTIADLDRLMFKLVREIQASAENFWLVFSTMGRITEDTAKDSSKENEEKKSRKEGKKHRRKHSD